MPQTSQASDHSAPRYLLELRSRLLRALSVWCLLFIVLSFFANDLYTLLAQPLLQYLPQGHLIATQLTSPLFVPLKLAFIAALLLTMPYALYQSWSFVAPALYARERRFIWPYLVLSITLFYAGIAFAYAIMLPLLFRFLAKIVPNGVTFSPDISDYFNVTINLLFAFGALFEIPIIMVALVTARITTCAYFVKMRSYAFLGAFIIGLLLAPPDVLSMTLVAIPIWLLYEVGIVMSRFVK